MQTTHPEPTAHDFAVARAMTKASEHRDQLRASRISRALRERECSECGEAMEPAEPYAAEPDVGIKAFAGGHRCTDCGHEVED